MSRKPGLYAGVPELDYHADKDSISSTMAREILKSPAHLRYMLDNPPERKKVWDIGHAVHAGVLGVGLDVTVLDYPDWRTKAAREERDEITNSGGVAFLQHEYEPVQAMIDAIRNHEVAGPLFSSGQPEVSMWAEHQETGLLMRGRVDWIKQGKRPILVDLKTTRSANPKDFHRSVWDYGYHLQQEWYKHIYQDATGDEPAFVFVLVESAAPHLVSVIELADNEYGESFPQIGKERMEVALRTYLACLTTNEWPGYAPKVHRIAPTGWQVNQHDEFMEESA